MTGSKEHSRDDSWQSEEDTVAPMTPFGKEISCYGSESESEIFFEDDDDDWSLLLTEEPSHGPEARLALTCSESPAKRTCQDLPISLQWLIPGGALGSWREFAATKDLTAAQSRAVSLVASEAHPKSEAAAASLKERIQGLGYPHGSLSRVLSYIKDEAPIIIHIDLESRLDRLAQDTHYRNQFETKLTCGCSNLQARRSWEDRLFQNVYKDASPSERVKYGVLNAVNDPRGVSRVARVYGRDYLVLQGVRVRTTFSDKDSDTAGEKGSCEWYAHVLMKYSDKELRAVVDVALGKRLFADSSVLDIAKGQYKEVQIHGDVSFAEHVEAVVVHPSRQGRPIEKKIRDWCAKLELRFQWMPPEAGGKALQDETPMRMQPSASVWRWRPRLWSDEVPWVRFDVFNSAVLEAHLFRLLCDDDDDAWEVPLLNFVPGGDTSAVELAGKRMFAIVIIDGQRVTLDLQRYSAV